MGILILLANRLSASEPTVIPAGEGLKFGTLMYLSYQDGTRGDTGYSRMRLKRGYLNIQKKILEWETGTTFEGRFTPDIYQDAAGNIDIRMKYLYGTFKSSAAWRPYLEFGLVHTPWFDYEEHINLYRVQGPMFIERNGTMNSADFGATVGGFFGPKMEGADFGKYPGRYGSFAAGIYNGGGYHASEKNQNKPVEARLSIRPLPDTVPGLQFTYFGVYGDGNAVTGATWRVHLGMISYEQKHLAATAQYYDGKGNQSNTAVNDTGKAKSRDGYSFFAELRNLPALPENISFFARYDHFNYDTAAHDDESDRYLAGVAWKMGYGNMWVLDYDTVDFKRDDAKDHDRVQLSLQVHF